MLHILKLKSLGITLYHSSPQKSRQTPKVGRFKHIVCAWPSQNLVEWFTRPSSTQDIKTDLS